MSNRSLMLVAGACLLTPFVVTACSKSESGPFETTLDQSPQLAVVPSTAALGIGEVIQLRLDGHDNQPIPARWASDNPGVAKVSSTGLVTALTSGAAIISASGPAGRGTATIAVRPKPSVAAAGGRGDGVHMVPLSTKGTWSEVSTGDPSHCQGFPGSFPVFNEYEGTSSHLGRVTGASTTCLGIASDGSLVFFAFGGAIRAANGDLLSYYGSAFDDPPATLTFVPGVSFVFGSLRFVGGTGRFRNAVGRVRLSGDYATGAGGNFVGKGMVSSVGSSE